MSFFSFFLGERKKKTASQAKERLQLIIAHERSGATHNNYLPQLQQELIEVIRKYVAIAPEDIKLQIEKQDDLEVLEVKIEFPENTSQQR